MRTEYLNAIRVGWFLAVRQIRHAGRGTTTLIIFIMVLAFLNLVVVSGLLVGLIAGSFQQFREGYSGEVIITSAPGKNHIEHSQDLVAFLKNRPDVERISARHAASAVIRGTPNKVPEKDKRANEIAARLVGIDPEAEERITRFSRFIKRGRDLRFGPSGAILIGANLIKKYSSFADANIPGLNFLEDVDVGSRVRVTITTAGGETVRREFVVAGIVKSKIDEISTRAFMEDGELKRLLPAEKEEVQEIAVKMDYAKAPELVRQVERFIGPDAARVQTADQAIPQFLRDIESTMNVLGNALSSIALIVASITVFIVIFINAVTKRKYIGIMKGIGISPGAIQMSYILQAVFYGAAGSLIGLLLTFAALKPYFQAYPIDFPFSDGILVATSQGAFWRAGILLLVTLFAGYFPAKIIVRKNTLDAILGR